MISAAWFVICLVAWDEPRAGADAQSPDRRYQSLAERYESAYRAYVKASQEAKKAEEFKALEPLQKRTDASSYAAEFLALADAYPRSTAAEDSLLWMCTHVTFLTKEGNEALRRLARDHARSAKLGPALAFQGRMPTFFESVESFFRGVLAENPHREIRGLASYWFARHLLYKARCVRAARQRPDFGIIQGVDPYKNALGADWAARLRRLDPEAMEHEAEALLERVARFYADVPHNDPKSRPGSLGEAARSYLREQRELAVGKPAPEIEGTDLDGRPFRLSDYRGRVVVLDFGSHFYCGFCRELYPRLRDLTARLQRRPFAVVSINSEPEKELAQLKDAWSTEGNTWRCLFDGTWEGPIQRVWNIRRFPTIYVLDGGGVIRHKDLYGRDLEQAVDGLLQELGDK
jgi:thiol-disulfide isomerase/thioredoxin